MMTNWRVNASSAATVGAVAVGDGARPRRAAGKPFAACQIRFGAASSTVIPAAASTHRSRSSRRGPAMSTPATRPTASSAGSSLLSMPTPSASPMPSAQRLSPVRSNRTAHHAAIEPDQQVDGGGAEQVAAGEHDAGERGEHRREELPTPAGRPAPGRSRRPAAPRRRPAPPTGYAAPPGCPGRSCRAAGPAPGPGAPGRRSPSRGAGRRAGSTARRGDSRNGRRGAGASLWSRRPPATGHGYERRAPAAAPTAATGSAAEVGRSRSRARSPAHDDRRRRNVGAPTGVRHCPECGWPRRVRRSALSLGPKGRYALSHSGQHRHRWCPPSAWAR